MEPHMEQTSVQSSKHSGRQETFKYLFSFFWMMLFTGCAFYVVAQQVFTPSLTFWALISLAIVQVFLQLSIFMHLDQKGHKIQIIFFSIGVFIAGVSAVVMVVVR
ncbi:cytochrome C oxidase subunit IV family protein [Hazenella coriacea]|uniref:Cytochrome c oxidase subunit 4 n=1 Tax=Hazenella coriacea TaxID=1179467 RepID=A0A4R3L7C2_9BACL|nr:cytochrome C oxidase subunit IV family protein [Hazenella coriacea]TCS95559.1 cytochrome c oxidase subunit 4 [Hazenella coriacea]